MVPCCCHGTPCVAFGDGEERKEEKSPLSEMLQTRNSAAPCSLGRAARSDLAEMKPNPVLSLLMDQPPLL